MDPIAKKSLRTYFILAYVIFWLLLVVLPLLAYTSITYLVLALLVVAFGRRTMMRKPASRGDSSLPKGEH